MQNLEEILQKLTQFGIYVLFSSNIGAVLDYLH